MAERKRNHAFAPEIVRFRGRFFAFRNDRVYGYSVQKYHFKKRAPQDFEQLSSATKAQYLFLKAESAMLLRTFCLFSYFSFEYLCLAEGRLDLGYICKKIIATAATACTTDAENAALSGAVDRNKLLSVNNPFAFRIL